jgi:hypothetical protein
MTTTPRPIEEALMNLSDAFTKVGEALDLVATAVRDLNQLVDDSQLGAFLRQRAGAAANTAAKEEMDAALVQWAKDWRGEDTPPAISYRVAQGGLMRCCLSSLDEHILNNGPGDDGDRVACAYCKDTWMIREGGTWRWDH